MVDEKNTDTMTENVDKDVNETVSVDVADNEKTENKQEKKSNPLAAIKDQKGLKAKIKFFFDVLENYPDIRQMIMFTLFSMLCGLGQLSTTYILKYSLETVPSLNNGYFQKGLIGSIYIFNFPSTAEFIGFLCGSTVGQVLTFILNRKKTFRATNNVVVSAIMYAILAVAITLLQTLLGGWVTAACQSAYTANNGVEATGLVGFLITLTGLAVGGIMALVTSFLGNKYLVMRDWGKKNKESAN